MIKEVKRSFIPGEEWLYYKIYCGIGTTDKMLREFVEPLVDSLFEKNVIIKWFFIRYSDPDNHLRVRFLVKDILYLGLTMFEFKERISCFIESKQIWSVQLDTYNRELERYGQNTIEQAESFFYYDSENALSIINQSKNEKDLLINTLYYIEEIISLFDLTKEDQLIFLNRMEAQFKNEFNAYKNTRKYLSLIYRDFNIQSSWIYSSNKNNYINEVQARFLNFNEKNKLKIPLENILSSFIHMTVNRVFNEKQRMYEMLIYDFLYKKYKSQLIRDESF